MKSSVEPASRRPADEAVGGDRSSRRWPVLLVPGWSDSHGCGRLGNVRNGAADCGSSTGAVPPASASLQTFAVMGVGRGDADEEGQSVRVRQDVHLGTRLAPV